MPILIYDIPEVDCRALERLLARRRVDAIAYYKDPGGEYPKGQMLHVSVPLSTKSDTVNSAVDRLEH